MIPAIERGFPQTEIANASYQYQRSIETGESVIVGVNKFTEQEDKPIELLQIDATAERRQIERLCELKKRRSAGDVAKALANLKRAADGDGEHHAGHLGCGAGICDGGGDLRGARRGFWVVHRDERGVMKDALLLLFADCARSRNGCCFHAGGTCSRIRVFF